MSFFNFIELFNTFLYNKLEDKNMSEDKYVQISKVIEDDQQENQENNLLDIYLEKFKNLEIDVQTRKVIAKELSVEEQKALNWKTVADVFSFIDSSTLAKEHPKEAARILKFVSGILAVIYPLIAPISAIIVALPEKKAALLVEWLGKPTPEHVVHEIAKKKSEGVKNILNDKEVSEIESKDSKDEEN